MLSNALVKSMKAMKTGLLNSIDFSIICSKAIICSITPPFQADRPPVSLEMRHRGLLLHVLQ